MIYIEFVDDGGHLAQDKVASLMGFTGAESVTRNSPKKQ